MVVDADLSPQDMILFTGMSLYQATGGYLSPSIHRTDHNANLAQGSSPYGRCSVAFKLMPRASAILHCAAMNAAGHPVGGPFQQPVAVHDFMQRSHAMDQLVTRPGVPTFAFSAPVEGECLFALASTSVDQFLQVLFWCKVLFTCFKFIAFFHTGKAPCKEGSVTEQWCYASCLEGDLSCPYQFEHKRFLRLHISQNC